MKLVGNLFLNGTWRKREILAWAIGRKKTILCNPKGETSESKAPVNGVLTQTSMDHETYLFVYGTLRKPIHNPLHRLLETEANWVATGTFQGKLYDLSRYPGAVPSRGKNDRILGEI